MDTVELLRVDFAIHGLVRNEDGEIVDQRQVAQGAAFPTRLDDLSKIVADAIKDENERLAENEA